MKNVRRKADGTLVNTNLLQPSIKPPPPPTREDLEYGKHGTQNRTEYENVTAIGNIGRTISIALNTSEYSLSEIAGELGIKESTITNAITNADKATVNVLLKLLNYLNIELLEAIK